MTNNENMEKLKLEIYDKCVELFGGTIVPSRLEREITEMRNSSDELHELVKKIHLHFKKVPYMTEFDFEIFRDEV